MRDIKEGDTVWITGMHLRAGDTATVLRVLPSGTHAEVRIHGHTPKHGEAYPAYPVADLEWIRPSAGPLAIPMVPDVGALRTEELRKFVKLCVTALVCRAGTPEVVAEAGQELLVAMGFAERQAEQNGSQCIQSAEEK
jgi:hypothetical protein